MRSDESFFALPLPIGRVSKQHIKRLNIVDAAKFGCIPPQDTRTSVQTKCVNIFPQQTTAFNAIFNKKGNTTASRQGLKTNGTRASKHIENARAIQRFRIGMTQYVKQAFAGPVDCRANAV
ncbi:hypothetical protein D3C80_1294460 [compost metagenome]